MILITGSRGWLGKHLCKYFEDVYHYDLIDGNDILKFKLPNDNIDLIIHLAAKPDVVKSIEDPHAYWEINVEGSKQVFKYDVPTIYTSTSAAKEWWLNPYATTKRAAEDFNDLGTSLRLTNLYADSYDGKEALFGYKFKNNKLKYISKGHSRDFIHVEDVCEVIYKLSKKPLLKCTFDLGSGISLNLKDIAPNVPEKEANPYELKSNPCNPQPILDYVGHKIKHDPREYFK
jgi:nucleoside-diphosphate-sugar epimerase